MEKPCAPFQQCDRSIMYEQLAPTPTSDRVCRGLNALHFMELFFDARIPDMQADDATLAVLEDEVAQAFRTQVPQLFPDVVVETRLAAETVSGQAGTTVQFYTDSSVGLENLRALVLPSPLFNVTLREHKVRLGWVERGRCGPEKGRCRPMAAAPGSPPPRARLPASCTHHSRHQIRV